MAGMLPGVECARRRRFYGSGPSDESEAKARRWTRRTSFCLHTISHVAHLHPFIFLSRERSQYEDDTKLEGEAREAKDRLDERFKNRRNSDIGKRRSFNGSQKPFACVFC